MNKLLIICGPTSTGKTSLGILLAKKYNDRGLLIPGKYVADLIKKNVDNKAKYILDGFPRDLSQARKIGDKTIDKVVYIYASNKTIIRRLLRRAKIEGRKDDTLEIIKKRILVYEKETKPLLKYYKNKLIKVNGDKDLKEVTREILSNLTCKQPGMARRLLLQIVSRKHKEQTSQNYF